MNPFCDDHQCARSRSPDVYQNSLCFHRFELFEHLQTLKDFAQIFKHVNEPKNFLWSLELPMLKNGRLSPCSCRLSYRHLFRLALFYACSFTYRPIPALLEIHQSFGFEILNLSAFHRKAKVFTLLKPVKARLSKSTYASIHQTDAPIFI